MPVRCAVCETDNFEDDAECSSCGRALASSAPVTPEQSGPVPGLERTLLDPVDVEVDTIAGLEQTGFGGRDVDVEPERIPGVELTRLEADPSAASNWTGGVEVDRGRDVDTEPRTPAPAETAACPFCGVASLGAVCDHCGRRKARFAAPSPLARIAMSGESRLCPACFARVPASARCEECGVPFPVQEL